MAITFDAIPALRTPGTYIEFNNELAGATSTEFNVLIIGQRLTTGTVAEGIPTRVTDPGKAAEFFGVGSQLHRMCSAFLAANRSIAMTVIALDDDTEGAKAAGTITVDSVATKAGTLYVYIGGQKVSVAVATDDTVSDIAANIAAKINADTTLPVTAAAASAVVTITARHKGESFNGLPLHTNYHGQPMPDGLGLTIAQMTGGTANPDATVALDAMGDTWYNWLIMPYTDSANISALTSVFNDLWGPLRQRGCRAFAAYDGTFGESAAYGAALNSPHLSVMGANGSPTPCYEIAAIDGAIACFYLAIDPARQLQTLELTGMLAPAVADRWTREERDMLLYDGIATFTVSADGTCRIDRQITTYQVNASDLPDASYLDITTPETLERMRRDERAMIAQKYPRHKLADDGTVFGAGQTIITPVLLKADLLAQYRVFEAKGWVEDFEGYKETLIVERDIDDRNRLNWLGNPNLVNQARVFAGKTQFIL